MNQRGFTLVEIIIALTILSMLFIVISYIQARGAASYAATSQSVEVQESLRIALNKMSRELKGAEVGSIEISADGQKILFSSANVYSGFQFDEDGRELEIDVDESVRESWQPFASNICEVFFRISQRHPVLSCPVEEIGLYGRQHLHHRDRQPLRQFPWEPIPQELRSFHYLMSDRQHTLLKTIFPADYR
jgi:prepilin-type N-terminal cleavage/methylation domain-containing protein